MSSAESESTTVKVSRETHARLKNLKQFDSMSFDELIDDMADVYEVTRTQR